MIYKSEPVLDLSLGRKITDDKIIRLDGKVLIIEKNYKQSIINLDQKNLNIERNNRNEYDYIDKFLGSVAIVKLNNKYGVINDLNEEIVPPVYDVIEKESEVFKINDHQLFGFVSKKGYVLFPKYKYMSSFKNGLSVFMDNNKYGVINDEGRIIINSLYDNIYMVNSNRFIVTLNDKQGVIDHNNELIIAINNKKIVSIRDNNYFCVKPSLMSNCHVYNLNGKFLKKLTKFERYTSNEYMPKNSSEYALADDDFNLITPFKFQYLSRLYGGLAIFSCSSYSNYKGYTLGLINDKGQVVDKNTKHENYKHIVDDIIQFKNGNNEVGFIKNGKIIKEANFESLIPAGNIFIYRTNNGQGLMDFDGRIITTKNYDALISYTENYFLFKLESKYYLLNNHGEGIVELNTKPDNFEIIGNLISIKSKPISPMDNRIVCSLYDIFGNCYFKNEKLSSLEIVDDNNVIVNNIIIDIHNIKYTDYQEQSSDCVELHKSNLLRQKRELLSKYYSSNCSEFNKLVYSCKNLERIDKLIKLKQKKEKIDSHIDQLFEKELNKIFDENNIENQLIKK